jgi:hypothetical protein
MFKIIFLSLILLFSGIVKANSFDSLLDYLSELDINNVIHNQTTGSLILIIDNSIFDEEVDLSTICRDSQEYVSSIRRVIFIVDGRTRAEFSC